ncbi:uncharacterized protein EHS24_002040 [Apiotrichum porosum]|uniref:Uncharacterized protein n=1 Tax=Apiotrichum porosum TaxID=105984 RepID=A0A427XHG6_9TREE|nr:uncharacterized protein EHS24_002040 [Apiotrichum porosum]RSH78321.1 hypothetical protein EHS24_002040 [Apiotrichum porosum]
MRGHPTQQHDEPSLSVHTYVVTAKRQWPVGFTTTYAVVPIPDLLMDMARLGPRPVNTLCPEQRIQITQQVGLSPWPISNIPGRGG